MLEKYSKDYLEVMEKLEVIKQALLVDKFKAEKYGQDLAKSYSILVNAENRKSFTYPELRFIFNLYNNFKPKKQKPNIIYLYCEKIERMFKSKRISSRFGEQDKFLLADVMERIKLRYDISYNKIGQVKDLLKRVEQVNRELNKRKSPKLLETDQNKK